MRRNYYQNIIYEKIQLKNKNRLELEDNTYPDTLAVKYSKKKKETQTSQCVAGTRKGVIIK